MADPDSQLMAMLLASQNQANPWQQAGQGVLQAQVPYEKFSNPWQAIAAGLAQGTAGGLMAGYGNRQVREQQLQQSQAIQNAMQGMGQIYGAGPQFQMISDLIKQNPQAAPLAPMLYKDALGVAQQISQTSGMEGVKTQEQLKRRVGESEIDLQYKPKIEGASASAAEWAKVAPRVAAAGGEAQAKMDVEHAGAALTAIMDAEKDVSKLTVEGMQKSQARLALVDRLKPIIATANGGQFASIEDMISKTLGTNQERLSARAQLKQAEPEFAAAARVAGSGATSDREFASYLGTGPQPTDTPQVAMAKLSMLEAASKREFERNRFIAEAQSQGIPSFKASKAWQDYIKTVPMFTPSANGLSVGASKVEIGAIPVSAEGAFNFAMKSQQAPAAAMPTQQPQAMPQQQRSGMPNLKGMSTEELMAIVNGGR